MVSVKGTNRYSIYFWIGFLVVILLNIFVWLFLNQVDKQFENELKNKLLSMGTLISRLIDVSEINTILPDSLNSIEYIYYQQLLDDITYKHNLQSALIASPAYDILVSAPELLSDKRFINLEGSEVFQSALNGIAAASDIQEYSREKFMSAYIPINNIDGFVMAVLIIEARAEYFHIISSLRNRLFLFSVINSVLIIMIAFFLSRMIKKSIRYQTEIKEREHLVQLGTMAATVAHELRNPLNIIEATNDHIHKKYANKDDEVFSYIPEEIRRLSIMIDNFLKFARNPVLNIERKSISQLIGRVNLNLTSIEKDQLEIVQSDPEFNIKTDHSLLEQALINLIKNAAEANDENESIYITFEIYKKNLKITVEDKGRGISNEIIDKIFDPFFTTKETGTGLGLAITKRIIDQLSGEIEIHSDVNKGTKIEIIIPNL